MAQVYNCNVQSADKVVAAVEETTDANTIISVHIELPGIDFSFFDDAFDTAIKEAQFIYHCSNFLLNVSFAILFPIEVSDCLL